MQVVCEHHQPSAPDAMRLLDEAVERAASEPLPHGIALSDVHREWDGARMRFSFKAKWNLFSTRFAGTVELTETSAALDLPLPPVLLTLVAEPKVRLFVEQQMGRLFQP